MGGASLLAISCSNSAGGSGGNSAGDNTTGGSSGGGGTSASYIGSKKPTDAWAVGDFVYSDGSADSKDATLDATKKAAAVAVIFDATNKKGVGLKKGSNLQWAPSDTTGYKTKFTTDLSDGSGNWAVIQAADASGAENAATNYPAFNFCNTYGVAVAGVSSGWYLPAKNELLKLLYKYKDTVNASIAKIGESAVVVKIDGDDYWSSSNSSKQSAYKCPGENASELSKYYQINVRAIRKF